MLDERPDTWVTLRTGHIGNTSPLGDRRGWGLGKGTANHSLFGYSLDSVPFPNILVEACSSKLTTSSGEECNAVEGVFGYG